MKSRHHLPHYRIAVVGSGAVGSYYGARLAEYGREVHFLIRSGLEQVKRFGIRIKSRQGNVFVPKVHCHASTTDIGPVDLVLIALKSTDNSALETLIPPLLKPGTMLLTLQNGLGNEEYLAERFGPERVLGGLCFVCLNRETPGLVHHLSQGHVILGEFSGYPLPRTLEVQWEFKRCGVPCTVSASLGEARWRKLAWNVPFNGLPILSGGKDVARILADEDLSYLARRILDEVIGAARVLGHAIPTSFADTLIQRTREMGPYRPSSLLDFESGRAVEIESIWGEPYRRAFNAGAECGRMEMLYHQIRHLTGERVHLN